MNYLIEKLKGYKTLIWAVWPPFVVVLVSAGVVGPDFQQFVEAKFAEYYAFIIPIYGAIAVLIRAVTDSPIFKKEK